MPRYVILHHLTPPGHARPTHWDLMLESRGVLRTWALPHPPGSGQSMAAEALPDHRLNYLTYEGPVSADRGRVARWDQGQYTVIEAATDQWSIQLAGRRLQCAVTLTRDAAGSTRWQVSFGQTRPAER